MDEFKHTRINNEPVYVIDVGAGVVIVLQRSKSNLINYGCERRCLHSQWDISIFLTSSEKTRDGFDQEGSIITSPRLKTDLRWSGGVRQSRTTRLAVWLTILEPISFQRVPPHVAGDRATAEQVFT